ncbi:MAG: acyl transferase [Bacteroidota bacterium]
MIPFDKDNFIPCAIQSKLTQFDELATALYIHQSTNNPVLQKFIKSTSTPEASMRFLPVEFFKTHEVITGTVKPGLIFTSSTTSGGIPSRHYVANKSIYERSYLECFRLFYGEPADYVFLCLLPSYLERTGSSLIDMAQGLITASGNADSGFYLYDFEKLNASIHRVQQSGKRIFLLGVTFALLDFAETFHGNLAHAVVMETGGMKGRKEEQTRDEVHRFLRSEFKVDHIHSEYGMTELLSQAYAKQNGRFSCPPWMKILITDLQDPFCMMPPGKAGLINVIDLANMDSCAFIQTSDIGRLHPDGSFEVLGRMDHSEIRGCNLMYQ